MSQKQIVDMRVAVHPIKAKLWGNRARIEPGMSLREIGALIKIESPQKIKHHLQGMVSMGAIDYVRGEYVFPGIDTIMDTQTETETELEKVEK